MPRAATRLDGLGGVVRDRLTDFRNPASGAFYFAPSVEALDAALA